MPAILSAIVQICDDDFHLTPDGFWNELGPRGGAQSFENVNLTCFGKAPSHSALATEYQNLLDNFGRLMDDAPIAAQRYNTIDGSGRIKFHHKLFDEIVSSAVSNREGVALVP
jgi:hypothetical protein